jgi:hypothetical protein
MGSNSKKKHRKPDPQPDDIFFLKSQIKVGGSLVNVGRMQTGSRWSVIRIMTHEYTDSGRERRRSVDVCEKLMDAVTLENRATGERRTITFGNLSYSAIWRLRL